MALTHARGRYHVADLDTGKGLMKTPDARQAVLADDERLPKFRINLANNLDLKISWILP